MDIVTFALKMKDGASQTIGKIAREWTDAAEKTEKARQELEQYAKKTESLGDTIGKSLKFAAIGAAAYKAGEFISGTIQDSLDRQKLQVSFDVLTGSKEAGSKLTKDLVDLQKNTILGGEVFEGAQTMLGFGIDQSKVVDTLRMIGDVSMGDAEKFKSLSLAFAQISSAGKLQGQDLMQLINAGFNPLNEISKQTGKSIAQLKDDMSKGAISAKMVEDAFKSATGEGGAYNDMLGQIAETTAGKMAQFSGAWQETKIKIGEAFQPVLQQLLEIGNAALPIIEEIAQAIQPFISLLLKIGKVIYDLRYIILGVGVAVGIIKGITTATKLWTIAQTLLNVVMTANPIGIIVVAVGALIGLIITAIKKYDEWGAAVTLLMGPLGMVINLVQSFRRNWDAIVEAFKTEGIIAGLKKIGVTLLDAILYPLQQLLEVMSKIPKIGDKFAAGAKKLQDFRTKMGAADANTNTSLSEKNATKETQETLNEIAQNTASNTAAASAANSEVASSGPKVVNVNVQKFFDNIQFTTMNLDESASKIEETVLEVLSRVLVQGATQSI